MVDKDLSALVKYVEDHVGKLIYTDLEKNLSNIVAAVTEYVDNILGLTFPKSLLNTVEMVEQYLKTRSFHLGVAERNLVVGMIHNFHEIAAGQMKIGVAPVAASVDEATPPYTGPVKTSKKFSLTKLFRKKDKKVVTNVDPVPADTVSGQN
jgi:hypothetical protein